MIEPRIALDESKRINDLFSYDILDSLAEQDFDDLAKLAANICHCEMASISFIDKDRQWFKSTVNISERETSRKDSFCGHTILEDKVMIVLDTKQDERFWDNPNVTNGLSIAFYAGATIYSAAGHALGTICVLDKTKKTAFSEDQIFSLKILAGQVSRLLQLRLKNKILIDQTEKIVATERKLTEMHIRKHDSDNKMFATELHENHLQTLATAKLYIEMAEQAKDLSDPLLKKGLKNITDVIEQIRHLSKKITPTTFDKADYSSLIRELIQNYTDECHIDIDIFAAPLLRNISQPVGLVVYRITEQLLDLSYEAGAKTVLIDLKLDDTLNISFSHNGKLDLQKHEWGYSNLHARAHMINAPLQYESMNEAGFHNFQLHIPLN